MLHDLYTFYIKTYRSDPFNDDAHNDYHCNNTNTNINYFYNINNTADADTDT